MAASRWSYAGFTEVTLFQRDGVWLAQDSASGRYFPNPSHCPYHVIFISQAEYRRIRYARAEGLAFPVFATAQQHFGRLPGFSFHAKSLETPDDYATQAYAVPDSEYVLTTENA